MRIWIDILTPKQLLFFTPLVRLLEKKGHEVYSTTRNYREITELSKLRKLKMEPIGEHGGGSLYLKLHNSALRVAKLAHSVNRKKIDKAISFSSVEAARVAHGLSIPHYCISDSPHAEAVSKLTIPLSKLLFTPWVIPIKAWTCYGINQDDIIQYKALDPFVWLTSFKPDIHFKETRGLTGEAPLITVRPSEEYAAYLLNSSKNSITVKIIDTLLHSGMELQIVILPRYKKQLNFFKHRYKKDVKVIEHGIDGADLLTSTDFFIGAGGTMTAEAVLLGTPAISCFPSHTTYVDHFLIKKNLIKHTLDPKTVLENVKTYVHNERAISEFKKKAKLLRREMKDPLPIIARRIVQHS